MISFESVTKQYPNGHLALDQMSFTIEPGEFVFLLGPSGSGKTTILRLILRETLPSSGQVTVAGHDISLLPTKEIPNLRRQIGSAFQDFKLLPDKSAFENVALALDILGKSIQEIHSKSIQLLEKVGLSDKIHLFPSQLSGGEIQRVAIARAIATEPVLLFADEPTGNLDQKTASQIVDLLKQIHEDGTTVIMATHDQRLAESYGYRQLHVDIGRLVKDTKSKSADKKTKPKNSSKELTDTKVSKDTKENQ